LLKVTCTEFLCTGLSIPHVANSPVRETFVAATEPPQKWVANLTLIPENRISIINGMHNKVFILTVNNYPGKLLCKYAINYPTLVITMLQ
jgi:hypothetical protein